MSIFGGYSGLGDMFDGGGPGASGDSYDNDSNPDNDVGGIASISNTVTGNSAANTAGAAEAGTRVNYSAVKQAAAKVKGVAPTAVKQAAGLVVSPALTIVGKVMGWATGINPTKDKGAVVNGRQTYTATNKDGTAGLTYSYNMLGLPYEVTISKDGNTVTDTLSMQGPDGMTGYERASSEQRALGNSADADAIMKEAASNAVSVGTGAAAGLEGVDGGLYSAERVLEMASAAGMIESDEQIASLMADPQAWLDSRGIKLADLTPVIDADASGTNIDGSDERFSLGDTPNITAATAGSASTTTPLATADVTSYEASTVSDNLDVAAAAVGAVTDNSTVVAEQIDMQGAATGVNADGSISDLGESLNDYASQGISTLIDTSTASGKILAQKLGEGNYTDSKATILGQMNIISAEFKDGDGNPKIPAWAQGVSREVSRTMAFSGITGTAATAAMSNAIMEATLGIAKDEASFFQTLTIKNLDNRQQSIINKANVMSNFEMANLDARQAAAVQNAKSFLQMDMANLNNEQQAEIINTQLSVDALFNDQSAVNSSRLFTAETANDFEKFYDQLSTTVELQNSQQINSMKQFNAGEINSTAEFNAAMEDRRQQFYSSMQYNIDTANAAWRQQVTVKNADNMFEAASTDVQNTLDISTEALNRTWDRVDNMLDFIFKGWNGEADRDATILAAQMQAQASQPAKSNGLLDGIFKLGAAWLSSDRRLKDNIQHTETVKGIRYYTWDWNDKAKALKLDVNTTSGVIAQEVAETHPDAVRAGVGGYLMVNYGMLQ